MVENEEEKEHGAISNVYIMVDGVCVFHLKYWGDLVEPNLVTGFLSAVASFAREVSKDAILKTVSLPPLKIVALQVMEQPQVIVSVTSDENFPIPAAEAVLQSVAKVFLDNYSQDIVSLRGIDLTASLSPEVRRAVLSSLKEVLNRLSRKSEIEGLLSGSDRRSWSG